MSRLEQLGTKISQCRQNKNMTQEELARRLGITPQALSKWERNLSYPDIGLLSELCDVLEVSADALLETNYNVGAKTEQDIIRSAVWDNLRMCSEPLALYFSVDLVPAFVDNGFVPVVADMRERLAREGILMPVLRLADSDSLSAFEFKICTYHKILYKESLEGQDENSMPYIMQKVEDTVRKHYADILTPDIMKNLTDNLQMAYPALVEGVVPEKLSYGLLTEVVRGLLKRGYYMVCLPKIIEYLDSAFRENSEADTSELIDMVQEKLKAFYS